MKAKLLTLLAVLLCATTAWAQTNVSTDQELRAAIQINNVDIKLLADLNLSNSTLNIAEGMTVTIDLDGHALDRKLTKRGEGGGQVITVRKGATLNLKNGTITGGWGGNGGGLVNEGGTVTLTDVNITGNTADDRGGGISNQGTLTMTGGSITGNTSKDGTDTKGGGGIMNSEGATATLTNVTITGNEARVTGGGGICNYGTLTLDGCTIQNNIAKQNGGGIWLGNEATLDVTGITVTGNTAGENGGGIYGNHSFSMQGVNTITDNTGKDGMANNVYLMWNQFINVTGAITGSRIGVTLGTNVGGITNGFSHYTDDPSLIFLVDDDVFHDLGVDSSNEVIIKAAYLIYPVTKDSELRKAIQIADANIKLAADIDLSNSTLSIAEGTTVTLDLGGHALDRKLTKRGEGGGQVITVRKGATLNLSNGTLKGGWGRDGGGLVNEGGTVTLTDVNITGNTADDRGGGISNHGTLTMTGGSITGNTTNDQTAPEGGGGIMNSEGATATLTNVSITGNTVNVKGGGGICNYGTMTLDGCTITGNSCKMNGGGIWTAASATLNMQGAMTVTGNTSDGDITNNLFLKTNAIFTITGSLAGSTVGVNMEATAGIFTSGYSTYNSGTDPATIFTPDISDVMAVSLDGNEAKLASILPEGAVYYIECSWDSHNKKVVNTTKILSRKIGYSDTPTEGDYKLVTNSKNEDDWFQLGGYSDDNDEYYVVTGNVSNNTLNVLGKKVHLILCDGAKLTLSGGILCYGDNYKLNIHSQSYGPSMGKLIAESGYDDGVAGIGSDCVISWHESWNHNEWGHFLPDENTRIPSDIEIHGGDIYAQGSEQAAGIGGGNAQSGGNLIIYGGKITAKGGDGSSDGEGATGIGGGNLGDAGNIKIYGGTVEAWGGRTSAGIGGGEGLRSGNIEIYDGNVIAHGGEQGAGIGSGIYAQDITVTINGGIVKAYGNDGGAGIGSGKGSGMTYRSGIININGGEVYAYGSDDAAGIGGGNDVNGADVTITGGYVYAKGDGNGAGIGSGCEGIWDGGKQGGRFTMTGGEVYAYGGVDAAGIGGGEDADGGTVVINGGYVYAEGQDYGPGIGGGQGGKGGDVTINGGIVIAKAGRNETGMRAIGPGEGCDDYGSLTIGDAMMVSSERMAAAVERKNMCWYRTQVRVEPCDHHDHTYKVEDTTAKGTHTMQCQWCTTPFEPEQHTFVDKVCTVCGANQTFGTGVEEVRSEEVKSEKWYTLDGRRLSGKPSRAGVYIYNGKMCVIK